MRGLAALALALALPAADARAVQLSTTRVLLPAGQADVDLWLDNPDPVRWSGQARLYRWEQEENDERLQPAENVALSPSVLDIAPGQRQRLRVVRLGAAPEQVQQAYRLVISPDPALPAATAPRYSLPVFLDPLQAPAVAPALQARLQPGLAAHVQLYNGGARHAHVADLVFVDRTGARQVVIAGLAGYVLPRQTRTWALPFRPDQYVGGHFQARLDHAAEAALPAAAPEIAAPAQAGL